MGRSFVITGATSFLGRYITRELCARGYRVYAIVRPESPYRDLFQSESCVVTVSANMGDTEAWLPMIPAADGFVHFGWDGIGSVGRGSPAIQRKNVEDTLKCMDAAIELGCKSFLFAGSQAEYGLHDGMINEQTICMPVTEYGKAKREVFLRCFPAAQEARIKWYQARIFSVYGVGDHPWTLVTSCVRTFLQSGNMNLSPCTQQWNYMYAPDAAKALCDLLLSGAPAGVYNVASHDTRVLKSFVEDIYRACGGRGSYTVGAYTSGEPVHSLQPDVSKLEGAIGAVPQTRFSDGIHKMIDFFQRTGEL